MAREAVELIVLLPMVLDIDWMRRFVEDARLANRLIFDEAKHQSIYLFDIH